MSTPTLECADATARPPGLVERFLLTPVGWPLAAASVAVAMLTLYAASGPAAYFGPLMLALFGWFVICGTWVARGAAWWAAGRRFGRPADVRSWRRWAVLPAVLGLTAAACCLDLPAATAFHLSRPRMERAARAALAHPSKSPAPVDLGLYGWSVPRVEGSSVYFAVDGAGFIETDGFVYSPAGPPAGSAECWPIHGAWYRFRDSD